MFEKKLENKLLIKVGLLMDSDQIYKTEKLIKDIEALLIINYQPLCNVQNIQTYSGRDLIIYNEGKHKPLKKTVSTEELE